MSKQHSIKQYTFSSSLAPWIERFIAEKRSLNYLYNTESKMLARFDKYLVSEQYARSGLTKEIVEKYTASTPYESVRNHIARYLIIQQFGKYLCRLGLEAHVSSFICKKNQSEFFVPYIFSDREIAAILWQADHYPYVSKCPHRHLEVPILLRMLYGCGLRVSEALNLMVGDVDFPKGVICIRQGKFNKDRLVPMSDSLRVYAQEYIAKRYLTLDPKVSFLPSPRGTPYSPNTINALFRKILFNAGISHGGRGKGPRVHDLRHTFAVHCLRNWLKKGIDVSATLPYLSTYLGHKNMQGTQRYLRLTAEMFPHITALLEKTYGEIIPRGDIDENF